MTKKTEVNIKNTIADSLIQLVQKENYTKITVEKIVESAGISRSTFYNYFDNKDELLEWVFIRDIDSSVMPSIKYDIKNHVLLMLFSCIKANRGFYERAVNIKNGIGFSSMVITSGCYHLSSLMMDSLYPNYEKKELNALIQGAGLASVLYQWIKQGMVIPIDEIINDFCRANAMPLFTSELNIKMGENR